MSTELDSLKTYTTRYRGRDGKMRAVLLWPKYERLLVLAGDKKPVWCVHITLWDNVWWLIFNDAKVGAYDWQWCPICGARKPDDAKDCDDPPVIGECAGERVD